MKLKLLVAAISIAAASGAWANDEVMDFGDVGNVAGGTYFASGFVSHDPGSFSDMLKFSLSSPLTNMWLGLGTIADQPLADGSNITGLDVSLYYSTDGVSYSLYTPIGSGDYISNGGPLAAGYYYFDVTGAATGPSASSYSYSASVSPVPEPESYAMLLAGLGMVGVIARRRMSR